MHMLKPLVKNNRMIINNDTIPEVEADFIRYILGLRLPKGDVI